MKRRFLSLALVATIFATSISFGNTVYAAENNNEIVAVADAAGNIAEPAEETAASEKVVVGSEDEPVATSEEDETEEIVEEETTEDVAKTAGTENDESDFDWSGDTIIGGIDFGLEHTAGYHGTRTDVVIPARCKSIGDFAFYDCSSITSITIPNGVTSIGQSAFSGCSSLTSIIIPDSVTSIGAGAFGRCTSLTSITLSNGVTSIGEETFGGCTSLSSIKLPNNLTSIGVNAFNSCCSLTSLSLPSSVTSIAEKAFFSCRGLTSLIIPNGVTSIKEETFDGCNSLTSITIPISVTSIGTGAFKFCNSLTNVTIPNSVTSIDGYAFYGCSSITTITIPNSVTSIGAKVFDSNTIIICNPDSYAASFFPAEQCISSSTMTGKAGENINYSYNTATRKLTLSGSGDVYNKFVWDKRIRATVQSVVFSGYSSNTVPSFSGCTSLSSIIIPETVIYIAQGAIESGVTCYIYSPCITQLGDVFVGIKPTVVYGKANIKKAVADANLSFLTYKTLCSLNGNHTWDSGKVTKAATCGVAGVKTLTCTMCNTTKTETTPATGNHVAKTGTVPATVEHNGYSGTICTNCNALIKAKKNWAAIKGMKISFTKTTYTGGAQKPTVVVKDARNKTIAASNYTVKYQNNKKVGTATVVVTFKGKYAGTLTQNFVINPKPTEFTAVTAVKNGYKLKWKKISSQNSGYQIQVATDKKFNNIVLEDNVARASTSSKKLTGLESKKSYYVRIRTYRVVGDQTYYSEWVKYSKKVKTK